MSNDYPPPGAGAGQGPSYPPPPPPPPGGYGSPPGGYGNPPAAPPPGGYGYPQPAPQNNRLAIASLVLGIVGICCGQLFVISIGAIVTGYLGRQQVAASQGRQTGAGMALAGLVLGVLGIVVGVLYWIGIATGFVDTTFTVNRS